MHGRCMQDGIVADTAAGQVTKAAGVLKQLTFRVSGPTSSVCDLYQPFIVIGKYQCNMGNVPTPCFQVITELLDFNLDAATAQAVSKVGG